MKRIEKVRTTRFVQHCNCCGKMYETDKEKEKWVEYTPNNGVSKAMICPNCLKPQKRIDVMRASTEGGNTDTDFLYRITVEGKYSNINQVAGLVTKEYNLKVNQYTKDNEVKMFSQYFSNLSGVKYILSACLKYLEVSSFRIEIGKNGLNHKSNKEYMERLKKCIKDNDLYHIDKISIYDDHIEVKYSEKENPMHTVFFFKDCITAIEKEKSEKWADKLVTRYMEGRAQCQRPERNRKNK